MKNKLRVRRLTLALVPRSESVEVERFLYHERMAREIEIAVATSSRYTPTVHGVEDWKASKLWVTDPDDTSDDEDGRRSLADPELFRQEDDEGFPLVDLV